MPMGELSDLLDLYAASEGNVTIREALSEEYFPEVR